LSVKVYIEWDDYYPFYTIEKGEPSPNKHTARFEIGEEELADYERVMREFDEWQKKLKARQRQPR
jgi:hypothetical protein